MKCLLPSLSHYSALVERLAVILRSGGMLVLVESELGYVRPRPLGHVMLMRTVVDGTHTDRYAYLERLHSRSISEQRKSVQLTPNLRSIADLYAVSVQLPSQLLTCIAQSGVFSSAVYHQEAAVYGASPGQGGEWS